MYLKKILFGMVIVVLLFTNVAAAPYVPDPNNDPSETRFERNHSHREFRQSRVGMTSFACWVPVSFEGQEEWFKMGVMVTAEQLGVCWEPKDPRRLAPKRHKL